MTGAKLPPAPADYEAQVRRGDLDVVLVHDDGVDPAHGPPQPTLPFDEHALDFV